MLAPDVLQSPLSILSKTWPRRIKRILHCIRSTYSGDRWLLTLHVQSYGTGFTFLGQVVLYIACVFSCVISCHIEYDQSRLLQIAYLESWTEPGEHVWTWWCSDLSYCVADFIDPKYSFKRPAPQVIFPLQRNIFAFFCYCRVIWLKIPCRTGSFCMNKVNFVRFSKPNNYWEFLIYTSHDKL